MKLVISKRAPDLRAMQHVIVPPAVPGAVPQIPHQTPGGQGGVGAHGVAGAAAVEGAIPDEPAGPQDDVGEHF